MHIYIRENHFINKLDKLYNLFLKIFQSVKKDLVILRKEKKRNSSSFQTISQLNRTYMLKLFLNIFKTLGQKV